MTGIMNQRRCGGCQYARVTPQLAAQDLTKRLCCGAPPSAYAVALPGGKQTIQMARPVVSVTDEACALWQPKQDVVAEEDGVPLHEVMRQ